MEMTEEFLHYIWKSALFYPLSLKAQPGETIEVIKTGELNVNSGPDFFNAMIKMGDTTLAGNIEIHINSSDWFRHGHHLDKAYDNVILQVVLNHDMEVSRTNGEIIPTAVIGFEKKLMDNFRHLTGNEFWIACEPFFPDVNPDHIKIWLHNQAIGRLKQKAQVVCTNFHLNQNNLEETFYQQLAHNFGFSLNGSVFELLARSLPYRILLKHSDNLFQIEAMLFGQAGMLDCARGDRYFDAMKREYLFLKRKYDLKPLEKHLWKFLRLRPSNFPALRIAQFASFLHETPSPFSAVLEKENIKDLIDLFRVSASEYWDTHFVFNKPSNSRKKSTGMMAIYSIIVNTVVPVLYFYGQHRSIETYMNRAIDFLREIPAENNSVISRWRSLGTIPENAFISQALLQQKNEYCRYRRCLECDIGSIIIRGL
jgi:hypothetical protein